jgi:zinc transport system substrate-binding protein
MNEVLLIKLYIVINIHMSRPMFIASYRMKTIGLACVLVLLTISGWTSINFTHSSRENSITNEAFAVDGVSAAPPGEPVSLQTNQTVADTKKPIKVLASFFPIYEFVKEIGGNKVEANTLIPIGLEPHDYEPTIQQIQQAESADIVFLNGLNFETSWINRINNDKMVDTSKDLNFSKGNMTTVNPHIWLDPILAKHQVKNIKDALIKADTANKKYYERNAANFTRTLDSLDALIRSTLEKCEKKDFITFHDAFSYFANRYGLNQHSITGVAPEGEILPQRISEIINTARNLGINVIYSEELVDPRFAEVIAQEIPGGRVVILSPIEGVGKEEQNAGIGYIDKMKENLNNLKIGLKCQ